MRIEFGCGSKRPKPGYIGSDIRKFPHVKYVCAAWNIGLYVKPGTVSDIYSRHMLEHLTFHDAGKTLSAWWTILEYGGRLEIMVPDLSFHIKQLLDPDRKKYNERFKMTEEQWALNSLFGWQRDTDKGQVWDVHKSGFDFPLLKEVLEGFDFKDIKRIENEPHHLHVECFK
jgi:predicted SAM-dependent methyltransferase